MSAIAEWIRGEWWHVITRLPWPLYEQLERLTDRLDPVGYRRFLAETVKHRAYWALPPYVDLRSLPEEEEDDDEDD